MNTTVANNASLASRVLSLYNDPKSHDFEKDTPHHVIIKTLDCLMKYDRLELDEAVAVLTDLEGGYVKGACGEMGGVNVFELDDGTLAVEWTTSDNSCWVSLEGMLDECDTGTPGEAPWWFDSDWVEVEVRHGVWQQRGGLCAP